MQVAYSERKYWDERYAAKPQRFDWYHRYWALKPLLDQFGDRASPVLHIGVGLSTLQDDMVRDGYESILNIDYSEVAISHMKKLATAATAAKCAYRVVDARRMPEIADNVYQLAIDKGTLDAVLCGPRSLENASDILQECQRVLQPGGHFIVFSFGDPASRMNLFQDAGLSWAVQVYVINKLEIEAAAADAAEGDRMEVLIRGPFTEPCALRALESLDHVMFAYVCTKPRPSSATDSASASTTFTA